MLVGEIFPRVAIRAVVLADCTPGTLTEIWAPVLPVFQTRVRFEQSIVFGSHEGSFEFPVLSFQPQASVCREFHVNIFPGSHAFDRIMMMQCPINTLETGNSKLLFSFRIIGDANLRQP